MRDIILVFGLLSSLFYSCSSSGSRVVKGGMAIYGDTVNLSIPEPIQTLHPLYNSDLYAHRIISNVFEPLFDLEGKSNKITPRLAEKYEWRNDQKVLRIYIRKGVYFHEDACFNNEENELTSADVKFTLEMACSQNDINQSNDALIGKIKGADRFFNKK